MGDSNLLPDLDCLHERHPGLTRRVCEAFAEAARVCMARHHAPPTPLAIHVEHRVTERSLNWSPPDERTLRAWNNRDDATRDGAYSVTLAAVETELGLVAISRADVRTGADYYIGKPGAGDLEESYRLEVSGVDTGDMGEVRRRLVQKVNQASNGDSDLPAFAGVVGFRERVIMLKAVSDDAS